MKAGTVHDKYLDKCRTDQLRPERETEIRPYHLDARLVTLVREHYGVVHVPRDHLETTSAHILTDEDASA